MHDDYLAAALKQAVAFNARLSAGRPRNIGCARSFSRTI